jgi:hypothetical protein
LSFVIISQTLLLEQDNVETEEYEENLSQTMFIIPKVVPCHPSLYPLSLVPLQRMWKTEHIPSIDVILTKTNYNNLQNFSLQKLPPDKELQTSKCRPLLTDTLGYQYSLHS